MQLLVKSVRLLSFAAASAVSLGAGAADDVATRPVLNDGQDVYLFNLSSCRYLSKGNDGWATLGSGDAVTPKLVDASTGTYSLLMGENMLSTSFQRGVNLNGRNTRWILKPVAGADNQYFIGCRDYDAESTAYMYYSTASESLGTQYAEPDQGGRWIIDDTKAIVFNELDDDYVKCDAASAKVRLRRTFTLNAWNSLCLPFNISVSELNRVFGDGTDSDEGKISVISLSGLEGNVMHFTEVTDNVVAGQPYLIWPTRALPECGYYEFDNVSAFAEAKSNTVTVTSSGNNSSTLLPTFSSVSFTGFLYKTTAGVGTYVLRKNQMYEIVKEMPMKGFRAFFTPGGAAKLSTFFVIDSTPTDVSRIFATGEPVDIYDVNGVLVRQNATNADGLPHGVYVVKGRKFVVK